MKNQEDEVNASKGGRPKSDDPYTYRLVGFVRQETGAAVEDYCRRKEVSKATMVRDAVRRLLESETGDA